MTMMIYRDRNLRTAALCETCLPPVMSAKGQTPCNETIPEYYSEAHAVDSGWVRTKNPMLCSPDKEFAWICPQCVTEYRRHRLMRVL